MSDSESESEYYNVEKIIAKEKIGNEVRYLVKWENFPEADCTWEPEDNLDNVKDLLEEFNNNINENERENEKDMINIPDFQKRKRGRPKKNNENHNENNNDSTKLESKREKQESVRKERTPIKDYIMENPTVDPKYGNDIPERIISLRKIQEDLFCLTKWKCRNDGIQPEDCLVKNSFYKQKYPKLLIEYYESRVRFVNNK